MGNEVTDPKRDLAIEAAEAIDPTFASSAMEVAEALDPSIVDRANARKAAAEERRNRAQLLIETYQQGLDSAGPRTAAELAELKALLLADAP